MNTLQNLLVQGYDIDLVSVCGGETYYIYLSHGDYGNHFIYGFGTSLDSALEVLKKKLMEIGL
jgi:hypothetical protein